MALDLDSVRLERRAESSGGWKVVAGAKAKPTVLGYLEPVYAVTGRRSGQWRAVSAQLVRVGGPVSRNRDEALLRLIELHQRSQTAHPKPTPTPTPKAESQCPYILNY